jgi:hypothetical protein
MNHEKLTSRAKALRRLSQVVPLEHQCSKLQNAVVCLRAAVEGRENQIRRLELLVEERCAAIDRLRYTVDRLRLENEILVAMIAA